MTYLNNAVSLDHRDKQINAMTQALIQRCSGGMARDSQNPYTGSTLLESAKLCLNQVGVNTDGMDRLDIAEKALSMAPPRGAQTTSDFPIVLENVMHKSVLTGFNSGQPKWPKFCKIGDVTDFRSWSRIVPGLIGNLDSVNEQGEYLDKIIPDGEKNSVSAERKGNVINITPEVIVNDDLGYINNISSSMGMAGQRTIERAVFTLLESNPVMSDGNALFSSAHSNYLASGSGTAPSVSSLDVARVALATQTAPGLDDEPLDIEPYVAVCNTALGGEMRVINESQYDPDTPNKLQRPNKVNGMVADIADTPRLSNKAGWYIFADPMFAPVIEVVFLNGQREPRVVTQEAFRTSGLSVKVELPFGVGVNDYRGAYYNYGS